ncbi:zinc finger protein 862-like [Saccoglossus kowalevskii]
MKRMHKEWKTVIPALHHSTMKMIATDMTQTCPNLSKLAQIALVIPISTADCEGGFNALARVKTQLRNRLSQKVLNALLLVSIEGPAPDKFNFKKAATVWNEIRNKKVTLDL